LGQFPTQSRNVTREKFVSLSLHSLLIEAQTVGNYVLRSAIEFSHIGCYVFSDAIRLDQRAFIQALKHVAELAAS